MKTLKIKGIYSMADTHEEVVEHLPMVVEKYIARRLHSACGYLNPAQLEEENARLPAKGLA